MLIAIFWSIPTACSNGSRLMFWTSVKWNGISKNVRHGGGVPRQDDVVSPASGVIAGRSLTRIRHAAVSGCGGA
jgi:hypothetical protein